LREHPISPWCRRERVAPVLTRLVVDCRSTDRVSARRPLRATGALALGHVPGLREIDRIVVAMWVELAATADAQYDASGDGRSFIAGRIFAEHALVALFAPPEERKVRRLAAEGYPPVPPLVWEATPLDDLAVVPEGAEPLGATFEGPVTLLGPMHTDANRHVNSLVAPRIFEEAALAAFESCGVSRPGLVRMLEIGYPRPCFPGQRVRARLQAWRREAHYGASGVIEQLRDDGARSAALVRVTF
jgi:hypothetical protein